MFSYTETIAATHQQEAIKRVVANAYRASGLSTEEGIYRIDSVRAEPVDSGGLIPDPEPSLFNYTVEVLIKSGKEARHDFIK